VELKKAFLFYLKMKKRVQKTKSIFVKNVREFAKRRFFFATLLLKKKNLNTF
jgi:hypothetical protein